MQHTTSLIAWGIRQIHAASKECNECFLYSQWFYAHKNTLEIIVGKIFSVTLPKPTKFVHNENYGSRYNLPYRLIYAKRRWKLVFRTQKACSNQ